MTQTIGGIEYRTLLPNDQWASIFHGIAGWYEEPEAIEHGSCPIVLLTGVIEELEKMRAAYRSKIKCKTCPWDEQEQCRRARGKKLWRRR